MRETWRRPIVDVCVKREIPIQFAKKLDVVRDVGVELQSSGIRQGWQKVGRQIQGCSIETEHLEFRSHQRERYSLRLSRDNRLLIINLLPGEPAVHGEECAATVYDISSDAATKRCLQLNTLHGTLQKVTQARVVPIVPAKHTLCRRRNLVSCRGGHTVLVVSTEL